MLCKVTRADRDRLRAVSKLAVARDRAARAARAVARAEAVLTAALDASGDTMGVEAALNQDVPRALLAAIAASGRTTR